MISSFALAWTIIETHMMVLVGAFFFTAMFDCIAWTVVSYHLINAWKEQKMRNKK